MTSGLVTAAVLIPLGPLLAGIAARGTSRHVVRITVAASWIALAVALVASLGLALALPGPATFRTPPVAGLSLGLRYDLVAAIVSVLVAFLGNAVLRFSRTYLEGDPRQGAFMRRLSLTLAAVLALTVAGDLLVLFASWVATSAGLHTLLLHHPERPGALFAARKKLVVSRCGDLCMLVALVLVYRAYGTFELDALFDAAARGNTAALPTVGLFLAACAMLKSAQFPFHSWLPDTMETPTPVSAFMHAGIINAGGFLVIRLSPLFLHAPRALDALAIIGTLTAAFGSIVMLPQPTVKRALAFSTIAQMGFMLLECGVGAFGLALAHLVAHSLYKAHAFLTAGSTIGKAPRAAIPLRSSAIVFGLAVGGGVVAAGASAVSLVHPGAVRVDLFSFVLALSLAYGVARLGSTGGGARTFAVGFAVAAALGFASLVLHDGARLLSPVDVHPSSAVEGTAALVFGGLFVFQIVLWRAGRRALGRTLYVHALNGFYVGTYGNRLLARLWPRARTQSPVTELS